MTAPGPAEPTPGAPASPPPAAPVPPSQPAAGAPVNPPAANPPTPAPSAPAQPTPAAPAPVAPAPVAPVQPAPPPSAPSTALAVPTPAQPPAPVQAAQPPAPAQAAQPPVPAQPAGAPPAKTPPKPPASTTAKPKSNGAYLVAVFALLIAVAAAGAAVYALKTAIDVRDGNVTAPLATPTADPDSSEAPEPGSTAATATPSPTQTTPRGPQYLPELVRAELRVPNPTGCTAAYVDVDTGNVGVDSGHEFYFSRCQDPSTLQVRIDRTSGRSTSGPDPSPQTCASLVAGTPSTELVITAQRGATFCLLTNEAQANAANLPQRLAIVEVLSVTTAEIRIALSTYRIEED